MKKNNEWTNEIIKELVQETTHSSGSQIVDIYQCKENHCMKVKIKLPGGRILHKNIIDLVNNLELLEEFDKKTIRTLTFLAAKEIMKPDFAIVSQKLGEEIDKHILGIRSRSDKKITTKSLNEISHNKDLLAKFSPIDANKIGYLAGIKETVKEFNVRPKIMHKLIEHLPCNVYWVDKNCTMINCNQNVLDMLNMMQEEFIGKTYEELSELCNWPKRLYQ